MGFGRVFIIIFVFALLEAMVLGQVAESIGWGVTILLTVLTAMMGSLLFRWQGMEMWVRLNQRLQKGDMPGTELLEGVMLLLGGALLITPGFITDAVGFLLLIPHTRKAMARYALEKGMMSSLQARQSHASASFVFRSGGGFTAHGHPENRAQGHRAEGSSAANDSSKRPASVYEDRNGHLVIDGESERKDEG